MNSPLALPFQGPLDKGEELRVLPRGHSGSQRNQPFISAVIRDDHAFHEPQAPQHLNVLLGALIGTWVKQLLQLDCWQVPCIAQQLNSAALQASTRGSAIKARIGKQKLPRLAIQAEYNSMDCSQREGMNSLCC